MKSIKQSFLFLSIVLSLTSCNLFNGDDDDPVVPQTGSVKITIDLKREEFGNRPIEEMRIGIFPIIELVEQQSFNQYEPEEALYLEVVGEDYQVTFSPVLPGDYVAAFPDQVSVFQAFQVIPGRQTQFELY